MTGCCRMPPSTKSGELRLAAFAALLLSTGIYAAPQFKPAYPRSQATAQHTPGEEQSREGPTFSIEVNLVRLLVSVRDAAGAVLTNLKKEDFCVTDSGVTQDIAVFEQNTSLPLSVAILVDTSGS